MDAELDTATDLAALPGRPELAVVRVVRATAPPGTVPAVHPESLETTVSIPPPPPPQPEPTPVVTGVNGELLSLIAHVRGMLADASPTSSSGVAHASLNRMEHIVRVQAQRESESAARQIDFNKTGQFKRSGRIADFYGLMEEGRSPDTTAAADATAERTAGVETGRRNRPSGRTILAGESAPWDWRRHLLDRALVAALVFSASLCITFGVVLLRRPSGSPEDQPVASQQ